MDPASLTLISSVLISGFAVFRLLGERNRADSLREQLDKVSLTLLSLESSQQARREDQPKSAKATDQVVIGTLSIQTAKYFPIIAKIFLAIEHPENQALVKPVHELIYNAGDSSAKEKLQALVPTGKDDCDIETLQFMFSVVNALLHCINKPDGATEFEQQLQEAFFRFRIYEKLTDDDRKELDAAMLGVRKESWLADYQQYITALENVMRQATGH